MVPIDAGDNLAFKISSNFFTKSEKFARYHLFSVPMLHVSPKQDQCFRVKEIKEIRSLNQMLEVTVIQ